MDVEASSHGGPPVLLRAWAECPYRASLAGGGSDLPYFYQQHGGAVVSAALDAKVKVTVRPASDGVTVVENGKTHRAVDIASLDDVFLRGALALSGVCGPLHMEILHGVSTGAGLGSSGAQSVAMMAALRAGAGLACEAHTLAEAACELEIDQLQRPVGKQDPYGVAFGGLKRISIARDGAVSVRPLDSGGAVARMLDNHVLLFDSGTRRSAATVLREVRDIPPERRDATLCQLRDQALRLAELLDTGIDAPKLGRILDRGWMLKASISASISLKVLDGWYTSARQAGAFGGRVLGAGGGGFLLLVASPERHDAIRESLGHPPELRFAISPTGLRVMTDPSGRVQRSAPAIGVSQTERPLGCLETRQVKRPLGDH